MAKVIDITDLVTRKQEDAALDKHNNVAYRLQAKERLIAAIEGLMPLRHLHEVKPVIFRLQEALYQVKKMLNEN